MITHIGTCIQSRSKTLPQLPCPDENGPVPARKGGRGLPILSLHLWPAQEPSPQAHLSAEGGCWSQPSAVSKQQLKQRRQARAEMPKHKPALASLHPPVTSPVAAPSSSLAP